MARTRNLSVVYALALVLASCSNTEPQDALGNGGSSGASQAGAPNGGAGGAPVSAGGASNTMGGAGGAPAGGSSSGAATTSGGSSGAETAGGGSAGTTSTGGVVGGAGAGAAGKSSGGAAGSAGATGNTPAETALPALRTVRQEHGVAALRGEIYVIGGYTPSVTATVEAYDPKAMSWRAVKAFPTTFQHPNVGVARDKLFVLGFYVAGDMTAATDQAFAYDPDANAWNAVMSLPAGTERAASCTAVLGDKIYVFGGGRRGMSVRDASVYDAAANAWQELPAMPTAREHCVAGAIGAKIYILGGRANSITGFEPSSLEFDPAAPGYLQKTPIPTARGGIAGAVLGGELFVFGGEGNSADPSGVFPGIDAYDPVTDSWRALPPMKNPRHGFGAAALDNRIYLMGGANHQGAGAVNNASVYEQN